jgi:hypothetical protein
MLNDQTYKIAQERSAHGNRKELRAGTGRRLSRQAAFDEAHSKEHGT